MSNEHYESCWIFNFVMESESGDLVPVRVAEELMDQIILWVEERSLQIGGGFREPKPEELEPGPIFEIRDEGSKGKDEGELPGSGA